MNYCLRLLIYGRRIANQYLGERFEVYEYVDSCFRVEMKVRCNADGNYLHVLRIYPK